MEFSKLYPTGATFRTWLLSQTEYDSKWNDEQSVLLPLLLGRSGRTTAVVKLVEWFLAADTPSEKTPFPQSSRRQLYFRQNTARLLLEHGLMRKLVCEKTAMYIRILRTLIGGGGGAELSQSFLTRGWLSSPEQDEELQRELMRSGGNRRAKQPAASGTVFRVPPARFWGGTTGRGFHPVGDGETNKEDGDFQFAGKVKFSRTDSLLFAVLKTCVGILEGVWDRIETLWKPLLFARDDDGLGLSSVEEEINALLRTTFLHYNAAETRARTLTSFGDDRNVCEEGRRKKAERHFALWADMMASAEMQTFAEEFSQKVSAEDQKKLAQEKGLFVIEWLRRALISSSCAQTPTTRTSQQEEVVVFLKNAQATRHWHPDKGGDEISFRQYRALHGCLSALVEQQAGGESEGPVPTVLEHDVKASALLPTVVQSANLDLLRLLLGDPSRRAQPGPGGGTSARATSAAEHTPFKIQDFGFSNTSDRQNGPFCRPEVLLNPTYIRGLKPQDGLANFFFGSMFNEKKERQGLMRFLLGRWTDPSKVFSKDEEHDGCAFSHLQPRISRTATFLLQHSAQQSELEGAAQIESSILSPGRTAVGTFDLIRTQTRLLWGRGVDHVSSPTHGDCWRRTIVNRRLLEEDTRRLTNRQTATVGGGQTTHRDGLGFLNTCSHCGTYPPIVSCGIYPPMKDRLLWNISPDQVFPPVTTIGGATARSSVTTQ